MPSIAQQDYLRPQGKGANDCHLLAALAHNIQQGTIFDTIMAIIYDGEDETDCCRVLTSVNDEVIFYYDGNFGENRYINVRYTQTQYEGLAAIQDELETYNVIPDLALYEGDRLVDDNGTDYLTCGGKCLTVSIVDSHIASISKSELDVPEGESSAEISWEDAQKLIGLPIH